MIVLQCAHERFHDDGETEFETIATFASEPDDPVRAIRDHLADEYGNDYETDVFESVVVYKDDERCCGVLVEVTDMEGDVSRYWYQRSKHVVA